MADPVQRPFGIYRTGLAALVIVQHVGAVAPGGNIKIGQTDIGLLATGSIAVLAFFSMSGFVMTEAAHLFYKGRVFAFIANRLLRIVPQYLLSLSFSVFATFVVLHFSRLPNLGSLQVDRVDNAFHLQNLILNALQIIPGFKAEYSFVPYVWALRIETIFYVFMAGHIFFCTYISQSALRFLAQISMVIVLVLLLHSSVLVLQYFPYFLFGGCAYFTCETPSIQNLTFLAGAFVLALGSCLMVTLPLVYKSHPFSMTETFIHTVLFTALFLLPLLLANHKVPRRIWEVDRRIGDLSFPIYLQQYALLLLFCAFKGQSTTNVFLIFAISPICAWLSGLLVDFPTKRLRNRIRGYDPYEMAMEEHSLAADIVPALEGRKGGPV